MALIDWFRWNKKDVGQLPQGMLIAKLLDGSLPIFSADNREIYHDDIVQTCISRIAQEVSKWEPQHIRIKGNETRRVFSSVDRLLEFGPNPTMNTSDFLAKCIWLLELNLNCFILPQWFETDKKRIYTAFHVLNPTGVDFLQDTTGKLFVKFYFNGQGFDPIAYDEIIHLKKDFSLNPLMGGGASGAPDNEGIKATVKTNSVVIEGLDRAMRLSMSMRGILKLRTQVNDSASKAAREKLEKDILDSTLGIIASSLSEDFTPVTVNPKLIDKDTLQFIQSKILNYYGVSLPIFNGDYTDEQHEAFFNSKIEPYVKLFDRAFSRVLFSDRELGEGNRIRFYTKSNSYLSTKSKLELIRVSGEQGLLTDDEKLAILGYPPMPDGSGSIRRVSLNYINAGIADEYQMSRAKIDPNRISDTGKKISDDHDDV